MHFNKTTGFRLLFFLAVITNICASGGYATAQKPLILNAASSTRYNPITTVPKISNKQPMVLNAVAPKTWDHDFQVFPYDSSFHRAGTLMLGLSELAIGIPGFILVNVLAAMMGGGPLKPADRFFLGVWQASGTFFTGRTAYAGFVNSYNGIAQDHKQITMHTKARLALGILELSGALLMGLCMIGSPSKMNDNRYGRFRSDDLILVPGLWGLAIVGAYDVLRASSEMNNGITIARF